MSEVIVIWDDEMGVSSVMSFDDDCEGALCWKSGGKVALFANREQARKAIKISKAFAALNEAQGKVTNSDFLLPASKCLKIVPVKRATDMGCEP